jgi:hypothetical protein
MNSQSQDVTSQGPKPLPRERTARSFWRSPAAWVILGLILIPGILLIRTMQDRIGGWRELARVKAVHLYEALRSTGAAGVDPTTLQSGSIGGPPGTSDLASTDQTYGRVTNYRFKEFVDSDRDYQTLEFLVDRTKSGEATEVVAIDSNGLIESVSRDQAPPTPPAARASGAPPGAVVKHR